MERPFQVEETEHQVEKERIAVAAAALISAGDTLILDVGTTVTAVARRLVEEKVKATVFTNGLNIAAILEADPDITTVVTGGTVRPKQHSLVNPFAGFVLPRIHADLAFLGINGIESKHGVTNVNVAEAEIKALFVQAARRRVVLADSSKIGKIALAKFAELREVDLLITDQAADPEENRLPAGRRPGGASSSSRSSVRGRTHLAEAPPPGPARVRERTVVRLPDGRELTYYRFPAPPPRAAPSPEPKEP